MAIGNRNGLRKQNNDLQLALLSLWLGNLALAELSYIGD
jgi:hypothetical protein